MSDAQALIDAYGESHQNPTNKRIHWVCVPVIMWTTVGLLWAIPHSYFGTGPGTSWMNWGTIGVILSLLFYFLMSLTVGVGMMVVGMALLGLCQLVETMVPVPLWQVCLVVFIAAWILQFVGHKIEGKKPSFLQDVFFLLVGPAWLLHFIYGRIGIPFAPESSA
jgi:uncharacterized membrane protein YGL010W